MTNSVDPDQLASEEASWSGSTLFVKAGHIRVQQAHSLVKIIHKLFFFIIAGSFLLDSLFFYMKRWNEPAHDKTYKKRPVRPAKTQISNRAVLSVFADRMCLLQPSGYPKGLNENPCQTGRMYSLIWIFTSYTGHIVGFLVLWYICSFKSIYFNNGENFPFAEKWDNFCDFLLMLLKQRYIQIKILKRNLNKLEICTKDTDAPVWKT